MMINFTKIGNTIDEYLFPICQQTSPTFLTILGIWLVFWYPEQSVIFNENNHNITWWLTKKTVLLTIAIGIVSITTSLIGAKKLKNQESNIKILEEKNISYKAEINRLIDEARVLEVHIEDAEMTIFYNRKSHQEFIYQSLSKYLMHISSDHLGYCDTERISIYRHSDNKFFIAGRYAQNIEFNKTNRIKFPENEGCIGEAWRTGNTVFKSFESRKGKKYNNWQLSEFQITPEISQAIRMKSHSYCAIPISENSTRVGVLLFESLGNTKLDITKINASIKEHNSFLIELLKESNQVADREIDTAKNAA